VASQAREPGDVRLAVMTEAFDFSDFKAVVSLPEMTLDMYKAFPEDASKLIEVVDGWIVRAESAEPSHNVIQRNFENALWEAVKQMDIRDRTCHRVNHDLDVLLAEESKFHFRRPDVVIYKCITADRVKWGRKPYASDCLLVLEIVSADSVTTDTRDKRAEFAAAGIPLYWIVRMDNNDGPAISVERLQLAYDGNYVTEQLAVRRRDFYAVDGIKPFQLRLTWEQLDDGL
jgi:Uma2 family endonuclease